MASEAAEIQALADALNVIKDVDKHAPGLIADDAKQPLDELGEIANQEKTPETRRALLGSFRSFIRAIATSALGKAVQKGVEKAVEEKSKELAIYVMKMAARGLLSLATGIPSEYGWLETFIKYLERVAQDKDGK
jgi:hypothetical protein